MRTERMVWWVIGSTAFATGVLPAQVCELAGDPDRHFPKIAQGNQEAILPVIGDRNGGDNIVQPPADGSAWGGGDYFTRQRADVVVDLYAQLP